VASAATPAATPRPAAAACAETLKDDDGNCGTCGMSCANGRPCCNGSCCAAGQSCVNGACTVNCRWDRPTAAAPAVTSTATRKTAGRAGTSVAWGRCVSTVPARWSVHPARPTAGGTCRNLTSDENNCGVVWCRLRQQPDLLWRNLPEPEQRRAELRQLRQLLPGGQDLHGRHVQRGVPALDRPTVAAPARTSATTRRTAGCAGNACGGAQALLQRCLPEPAERRGATAAAVRERLCDRSDLHRGHVRRGLPARRDELRAVPAATSERPKNNCGACGNKCPGNSSPAAAECLPQPEQRRGQLRHLRARLRRWVRPAWVAPVY
jgi:hypothetical protein